MIHSHIDRPFFRDRISVGYLSFLVALAAWLMIRGYPLPCCDDLAAIGAALSLAKGEGFTNPYVKEWMDAFPATKPFFYPPGLSYLQGSWLSVFGIGVGSLLAFQWTAICALACSTFFFLRDVCRQPASISLLATFPFVLAFQLDGLRGEPAAYALAMTGTCLAFSNRRLIRLAGYFSLAFSGVVYPIAPVVFAPIFLAGYLTLNQGFSFFSPETWKPLFKDIPLALLGGSAAFALFLWMIGGELDEFFRVMTIHKNAAIPGNTWSQLSGYLYICTSYNQIYIRLPLLILSGAAICWSVFLSASSKNRFWIIPSLLALACIISIVTNPMRAKNLVPALQIMIVLIACNQTTRMPKWLGPLVGVFFIVLVNLKVLLGLLLQKPADPLALAETRNAVSKIDYDKTRVVACSWTARYIYSYNIPPSVVDIATWSIVPKLHHNQPPREIRPSVIAENETLLLADDYYFLIPASERAVIPRPASASLFGMRIGNVMARQSGPCILTWKSSSRANTMGATEDRIKSD